jgi:glycosyltransferase involved in cell wall biosynthesis
MTASVIIPCFRQGRYLSEAVDSALDQTYPRVQVVVVNDGSDDDTDSIARTYGDRITYVFQKNSGLPAARNAGIRVATGDYLLFLDADDRLRPEAVSALVAEAAPDRLVVGRYEYFDDTGTRSTPRLDPLMIDLPAEAALLVGNIGAPFAFLSPSAVVRSAGRFAPRFRGCEDWDMWLRLQAAGLDVRRVEAIVGDYRLHPNSMTHRRGGEMSEMTAHLLRRSLAGPVVASVGGRTVGVPELRRRLRRKLRQELLDAAYHHRRCRHFGAAAKAALRAAAWTGLSNRVFLEVAKAVTGRPVRGG